MACIEYKEVPVESLLLNKRYKLIIDGEDTYATGTLHSIHYNMLVFNKYRYVLDDDQAFAFLPSYSNNCKIYRAELPRIQFYIPKNKDLAQQSMEKRALNKILQKLIGDTHFEWV
jgi:hypothetical protein